MCIALPFRVFIVLALLFVWGIAAFSQDDGEPDIMPYIKAWKTKGKDQSRVYEQTKEWGYYHKGKEAPRQFAAIVATAKHYLKEHPDKRLELRILMFELNGIQDLVLKKDGTKDEKIRSCLKLIKAVGDEQLLAELFAVIAWCNKGTADFLFYSMKANELQQKVGRERFPTYHSGLFNLSSALYFSRNYKESMNYGLKFLEYKEWNNDAKHRDDYVFQLDILGAASLKLGKYDQVKKYYSILLDTLDRHKNRDDAHRRLWTGVANGYMGLALLKQGKHRAAYSLLKSCLDSSLKEHNFTNATLALDGLAQIKFNRGQFGEALNDWKKALSWTYIKFGAIETQRYDRYRIALSISETYRRLKRIDSVIRYYDLYHKEKLIYDADIRSKDLLVIKAKLNFEQLNENLELTSQKLHNEKLLRNAILICIVLITIIVLFILNQARLKTKQKELMLQTERELAQFQVAEARQHIKMFKQNMVEKENLIDNLKAELDKEENQKNIQDHLFDYTLVTEEEWIKFKTDFMQAYPAFLPLLRKEIIDLSPAEERLSSLIALKLSNAQIGNMLGIGTDSVARSKRRLKARINLQENSPLEDYIFALLHVKQSGS